MIVRPLTFDSLTYTFIYIHMYTRVCVYIYTIPSITNCLLAYILPKFHPRACYCAMSNAKISTPATIPSTPGLLSYPRTSSPDICQAKRRKVDGGWDRDGGGGVVDWRHNLKARRACGRLTAPHFSPRNFVMTALNKRYVHKRDGKSRIRCSVLFSLFSISFSLFLSLSLSVSISIFQLILVT